MDWFNSLYRERHHLPKDFENLDNFFNKEVISTRNNGTIIMEDYNIFDKDKKYKNLFELRHLKHKYLIQNLPKIVKNYILVRHEDLLNNINEVMNKIKNINIPVKKDINFPINTNKYKKNNNIFLIKKNSIDKDIILNNKNFIKEFEKKLNYL